jgi:hypothetical protein
MSTRLMIRALAVLSASANAPVRPLRPCSAGCGWWGEIGENHACSKGGS